MYVYYVVFSTGHLFKLTANSIADMDLKESIYALACKYIDTEFTNDYHLVDNRFYVYTVFGNKIKAIVYTEKKCTIFYFVI